MKFHPALFRVVWLLNIGAAAFISFKLIQPSLRTKSAASAFVSSNTVVMLTIIFILWVSIGFWICFQNKRRLAKWLNRSWHILPISALLLIIALFTVTPESRIENDASNLLSTAIHIWDEHTFKLPQSGFWNDGKFDSFRSYLPSRPPLYQYLLGMTHTMLGFKVENAYQLNYFLAWLMLIMIFAFIRPYFCSKDSYSVIILALSFPIIVLYIAAADYCILYTLFLFISFFTLREFIKSPTTSHMSFLLLTLVLTAQVRPESIAVASVSLVSILIYSTIFKRQGLRSLTWPWIPLLLSPTLLQRYATWNNYSGYTSKRITTVEHSDFINTFHAYFERVWNKTEAFGRISLDPVSNHPYSTIVILIGALGLFCFVFLTLFKQWKRPNTDHLSLLLLTTIIFSAYWVLITIFGPPYERKTSRYYIFACIWMSIFAVYFFRRIKINKYYVLTFSVIIFVFYRPGSVEDYTHKRFSTFAQSAQITQSFLRTIDMNGVLLISRFPRNHISKGYSSIRFKDINRNINKYLSGLKSGKYKKILVSQRIKGSSWKPYPQYNLSKKLKLKVLITLSKDKYSVMQISEVVLDE